MPQLVSGQDHQGRKLVANGRGFHEKAHPCQALFLFFGRVTHKS